MLGDFTVAQLLILFLFLKKLYEVFHLFFFFLSIRIQDDPIKSEITYSGWTVLNKLHCLG